MEKENKITLGGFDAILDSFIPNVNKNIENIIGDDAVEEDELDNIKKNQFDPIADGIKKQKDKKDDKVEDPKDDVTDPDVIDDKSDTK
jgi:hypothetical protein